MFKQLASSMRHAMTVSSSRAVSVSVAARLPMMMSSTCRVFSTSASEAPVRPLVSFTAPNFTADTLHDTEIKSFDLEKNTKGKWKILVFYPLDFTFVCPTELIAFNDRIKEFHAAKAEIVGISVDSPYTHLAWRNTPRSQGGLGNFTMPLVSDLNRSIATKYQVYLSDAGVALRGLFIISPDFKIKHQSVNDLAVGRSVDETLRLLKAYQYVEKHGEVCPSGWQPGSEGMKSDPEGAKSYFKKVKDN